MNQLAFYATRNSQKVPDWPLGLKLYPWCKSSSILRSYYRVKHHPLVKMSERNEMIARTHFQWESANHEKRPIGSGVRVDPTNRIVHLHPPSRSSWALRTLKTRLTPAMINTWVSLHCLRAVSREWCIRMLASGPLRSRSAGAASRFLFTLSRRG